MRRAAYGVTVPLSGIAGPVVRLEAPGLAGEREIRGGSAGPGFCTLLGLRFRAGRDLVATDQNGVLVNEALARLMEPTGNVLGRQA
ncbi:MAG TPA: hypothetical protein DEH78_30980, partial [Solibacterales bacterium]|nr:hypothetical protein [Bryobacterales bacterium]